MDMTPYKTFKLEHVTVLTLLTDSINARNAHWIKDEILHFIRAEQPKGLLINLHNVRHLGHIGLGTLIAINNQIRTIEPHAFIGLQAEVQEKIDASHLEKVFRTWKPGENCPICEQPSCEHIQPLKARMTDFPAVKFDESQIPHLGEKIEHAPPVPRPRPQGPLDLDDAHPKPPKAGNKIGSIVAGALLLVAVGAGSWFAALKYAESGFPKATPLSEEDLLNKYDKNRDGKLMKDDLPLMDATERMNLTFNPTWCQRLDLPCSNAADR